MTSTDYTYPTGKHEPLPLVMQAAFHTIKPKNHKDVEVWNEYVSIKQPYDNYKKWKSAHDKFYMRFYKERPMFISELLKNPIRMYPQFDGWIRISQTCLIDLYFTIWAVLFLLVILFYPFILGLFSKL